MKFESNPGFPHLLSACAFIFASFASRLVFVLDVHLSVIHLGFMPRFYVSIVKPCQYFHAYSHI